MIYCYFFFGILMILISDNYRYIIMHYFFVFYSAISENFTLLARQSSRHSLMFSGSIFNLI